ncbi:hypothetical protein, partial [Burkholderia contaminans]|uniref:hypothetical protein n=1 Tax=Burkholderia contaminans TaxID=488447 RepID=UPI002D7E3774
EVRPEYERNSPRMSSNSYVNLKIATCLVRYADDRLIDQRFPREKVLKNLMPLLASLHHLLVIAIKMKYIGMRF